MSESEPPIACTLDGPSFKTRIATIGALFKRALRNARRDGQTLHLTFAPEVRAEVDELVRLERACCLFVAFDVRDGANGVELTITAPNSSAADDLLSGFSEAAAAARSSKCGCG